MPIVQLPENYTRGRQTYLCETSVVKNRVVIAGTAGVVASGTRREGVVRNPLTAASTSVCGVGFARGSAAAAGDLCLIEVLPHATGPTGTEVPVGVTLQTGAVGDPVLVATRGLVMCEISAAVKDGQRVGASGTDGRITSF